MKKAIVSGVAVLAVLVGLLVSVGVAGAVQYSLENIVIANQQRYSLKDMNLRLYDNAGETNAGRDGSCHMPSNENYRATSWSCTVKGRSFNGASGVLLETCRDGDMVEINDRTYAAHTSRPRPGWRPYCTYRKLVTVGDNYRYHRYLCAYFIF